ncbi:MAG: hypothetical protein R3D71_07075 [Rickettsiales bacterium]
MGKRHKKPSVDLGDTRFASPEGRDLQREQEPLDVNALLAEIRARSSDNSTQKLSKRSHKSWGRR